VSIHILKRGLGGVLAAAALAATLPVGSAHASGFCTYGGERYEVGDRIVTVNRIVYECISTNIGMYWQYRGTSPGTGPWTP
jgi:hypothetical protein